MAELWSVLDAPREEFELRGQRKRMTWLTPRGREHGAEAFYSESLGAGAITRAHFHEVDQFQLFVEGRQRVGSRVVEPVTLHYADAFTPYGPIVGDDSGVHYLTYRAHPDPGARFMPESRGLRQRLGGRHATVGVPMHGDGDGEWAELVEPRSDGLGAAARSLAPGDGAVDARPVRGALRALVVVGGTWSLGGREHPMLSSVVVAPGEPPMRLCAGSSGLTVVSLDFPLVTARAGNATASAPT